MSIIISLMIAVASSDGKPMNNKEALLSHAEEQSLRAAVYEGKVATAIPRKGRWALYEILVAPEAVMSLQEAKKKAALAILLEIVKGGRPTDAQLAAGYALCLVDDPVAGAIIAGRSTERFDQLIKDQDITLRQKLVEQVQKLFDAAAK